MTGRVRQAIAFTAFSFGAISCAPTPPVSGGSPPELLIENVRVFDPRAGTFGMPTALHIRGNRIVATGDLDEPVNGVTRLDAAGRYALPGLWDSHVHLSFLSMQGDSVVRSVLEGFARNGITSVRDVGGPIDTIAGISRHVAAGTVLGPRIYYTGPILTRSPVDPDHRQLDSVLPGSVHIVESPSDVDAILDRLAREGATMTKAIYRWDPALLRHLVRAAGERSIRVVWDPGLPILNFVPIDSALAIGVSSIEHARVAWPGVLRDELLAEVEAFMTPGVDLATGEGLLLRLMAMGEQSVVPERLAALAEKWARSGIYYCPTLNLTEGNLERGPPENYRAPFEGLLAVSRLFTRELSRKGVRVLVGQDFIDPSGTLREMQALARAGVDYVEILRGATLYPAEMLGVDDRFGTIEPGKMADILIVDGDPLDRLENLGAVWRVVKDGVVLDRP
jgi:hypothetical protein